MSAVTNPSHWIALCLSQSGQLPKVDVIGDTVQGTKIYPGRSGWSGVDVQIWCSQSQNCQGRVNPILREFACKEFLWGSGAVHSSSRDLEQGAGEHQRCNQAERESTSQRYQAECGGTKQGAPQHADHHTRCSPNCQVEQVLTKLVELTS